MKTAYVRKVLKLYRLWKEMQAGLARFLFEKSEISAYAMPSYK